MKTSSHIIFSVAFVVLIGAGVFLYANQASKDKTSSSATPSATGSTPSPSPMPLGRTFSNAALGLSFQYPEGYYVIPVSPYNRLQIQNVNYRLSGPSDDSFREADITYGSFAKSESTAKARIGVMEQDISVPGATIHLYTYPNPNNSAYTIAEAFWGVSMPFSFEILWDRVAASSAEGQQEADEVELLKKIIPTIFVGR